MLEERTMETNATPVSATLLQMMTGYWAPQALYVTAKLGIADLLASGPTSCESLAGSTGCHAPTLHRVLRALASVGVFTETTPGTFALTPLADLLRTGTPDSLRALTITYNEEMYRAWGELLYSVKTGGVAFDHLYGMPVFEYFAQHPESDRIFNEAMVGWTTQVANAVVAAYDFTPYRSVVDVGGGYGTLLAAILRNSPNARGILFDQPHVIADAENLLAAAGIADRCACAAGDFFAAVPAGEDVYVLAQILHDWDDERCVAILRQCRRAIPDHGKLLVVELVLPAGEEPNFGKWLDLHMLVIPGGRERTIDEFSALFQVTGFALSREILTPAGTCVVEAVPV